MVNLKLFEFQEEASRKLLLLTSQENSKQTILMKSPTGSGKTIILIDYIDKYLRMANRNTAFIWLCPGKGELEEQSRKKMMKISPDKKTQTIHDAMLSGFDAGTITYINWELVIKKGNNALKDGEKKNLKDRIIEAHIRGLNFIIIIDEEHQNNTSKANDIIDSFAAKHIIRVSATINENKRFEYFEIDESNVIFSGLITKAIYINEGIINNQVVENDYDVLLELADKKREEIASKYRELNKDIRPLVIIQFPNARPDTIESVEKKLKKMGYSYENGMVAKWMSEDKKGLENDITKNNGIPIFLLMKQAISTGWDCPRAKILVKLREGMDENFEIQTVGRIRRMPEANHYEDDILDFSYVYTFDEKYKEGLMGAVDRAYETRRLFLKEKAKGFVLEKQNRDMDAKGVGEREVLEKIYEHLKGKYGIIAKVGEREKNKKKLESKGYNFELIMRRNIIQGEFKKTSAIAEEREHYTHIFQNITAKEKGFEFLNVIDQLKKIVTIENRVLTVILSRLFMENGERKYKFLGLNKDEFYAFVINNREILKEELREIVTGITEQQFIVLQPKTKEFRIPEQDFFKYDVNVKGEKLYEKNCYKDYTSGYVTSIVRSTSEMLFEKYCEKREDIEWVYKNGDSGQQYFSIVYNDGINKQVLFYPDYIVKKKNGNIWIIETKGGEARGQDKNIDKQVVNKFEALKKYANSKNINWGFVRDKDGELYLSNTEYFDDMNHECWKPIENEL